MSLCISEVQNSYQILYTDDCRIGRQTASRIYLYSFISNKSTPLFNKWTITLYVNDFVTNLFLFCFFPFFCFFLCYSNTFQSIHSLLFLLLFIKCTVSNKQDFIFYISQSCHMLMSQKAFGTRCSFSYAIVFIASYYIISYHILRATDDTFQKLNFNLLLMLTSFITRLLQVPILSCVKKRAESMTVVYN